MININEDFQNIFNGLQALQNHLEVEINALENRVGYLEDQQNKDDTFFRSLEALIQMRNR